ncbi:MAG: fumarate reductase/succinate dehydrogenase flavoprotein subunit [Halobacteriales archaeon]|nr:fumarate reductase/succinate dehydrogenase flavoprotein subunit [Halobacteriales archaeon]
MQYRIEAFDVVVVGAGGAGLRAAIEASARGKRTAIICKSLLGKAHTVMAEGGVAAALRNVDERDNWQVHFRDTMRGGKFLNNWRMAQLHAQEAPERVRELERWGAVFDRTKDGWINQRNFGGHAYPRLAHVGDRTGLEIIRTLQDKGVHGGIAVFMEHTVVKLFKSEGRICGALCYERETGRFLLFKCKAIVLATGGVGRCYKVTSNSWEYTGDGQALGYEAGADLMDMEFTQFHPTAMVWPPSVKGILVTEGVRGEGGILRNSKGERFMFKYISPLFAKETADTEEEAKRWLEGDKAARRPPELLTRDEVARAIRNEVKQGRGTKHGGVFLDISWRDPAFVKAKLPSMYHQFKELAGVDITKEPMEVGPTMHYHMGGLRVDAESAMTTVPGLFAAGEVAAGLHGANRLGGNSLSDLLVFGKRAGEFAATWAERHEAREPDAAEVGAALQGAMAPLEREQGENPFALQAELQQVMQDLVGMIRERGELGQAVERIQELKKRAQQCAAPGNRMYNAGWHTALDIQHLLVSAEAITRSALLREESRGAHTRDDFPQTDKEKWSKVNVLCRPGADGAMSVTTEPLPAWPDDARKLIEGTLEAVTTKEAA